MCTGYLITLLGGPVVQRKRKKTMGHLGQEHKIKIFFRSPISVHFLRQMFSTLDILLVFRQTPFVLKVITYTIVFFSKTALICDYAGLTFHRRYSSPSSGEQFRQLKGCNLCFRLYKCGCGGGWGLLESARPTCRLRTGMFSGVSAAYSGISQETLAA